jgi:hypothetical protein
VAIHVRTASRSGLSSGADEYAAVQVRPPSGGALKKRLRTKVNGFLTPV